VPRSAGDWIATSLIGGSRWQAGETLMQEASPEAWARMVRLYNACGAVDRAVRGEAAISVRTLQPGPEGGRAHPRRHTRIPALAAMRHTHGWC
jgi:hypothetical protein